MSGHFLVILFSLLKLATSIEDPILLCMDKIGILSFEVDCHVNMITPTSFFSKHEVIDEICDIHIFYISHKDECYLNISSIRSWRTKVMDNG